MKKVFDILEQVANTSGTNAKIALLEANKDNQELLEVVYLELDPNTNFYMKKVPDAVNIAGATEATFEEMISLLTKLSTRQLSGNAAITEVQQLRGRMTEEMDSVFVRLLKKDLRTGLGVKNANKAFGKDFVKETPYMRCSLTNQKTLAKFKWLKADGSANVAAEVKMDGQYLNHIVRNGVYSAESRNGKPYDFLGAMDEDFFRLAEILKEDAGIIDPVFNGEAVVSDGEGGVLPRTTGNGIIQKFGKDTGNFIDAQNVIAVLWDVIPYEAYKKGEWKVQRAERRTILENALAKLQSERVQMVEYKMCKTFAEAYEYNTKMMSRGEEGTIIKDDRGPWKSHTSPWQLKLKLKFEIDLKVVGFESGTDGKKNENSLGALIVESACGNLRCKVGTGFKEKFDKKYADDIVRNYIWENKSDLLGKIVTIEANDIVTDKKSDGLLKLFLPVFVEWRHDKNEYDDIDRIREMKEAAIIALLGE